MTPTPPAVTCTDPGLFDELDQLFQRFVAFPCDEARHAVVLWIGHAHAVHAFESTPRLAVLSPEKGSGKTRVLEILGLVAPNPMHAVNISASALFRIVGGGNPPTLLLDEADTYLGVMVAKQHEDLRGLINAGHRRGATVYRSEIAGKSVKVQEFPAYAAAALAGIGDLPDTIIDRSIVITMRRRAQHEPIEPFRERLVRPSTDQLRDRLAVWAIGAHDLLADAWPEIPTGITDRAADVWEPLLAIGEHIGGQWTERGRQAAVVLNAARQQRDPSLGVQLLADCRRLFTDRAVDRMTTEVLLEALNRLDESPWGDLKGKALDSRGLARRLRKYEVRPGDHRFDAGTRKGYRSEDFHDAWSRYLPPVADVALVAHPRPMRETGTDVAPTEDEVGYVIHNNNNNGSLSSIGDGQQGQQGQQDIFSGASRPTLTPQSSAHIHRVVE